MKIVEDYKERIDVDKMYNELLTYHRINTSWRYINRNLLKTVELLTKLDNYTYIAFHTPDQVILFENWDGSNGMMTGIDFETGLKILEPYLRKKKISKLMKK